MPVVSDPLAELVGRGQNAKYIQDCKEMHLGGKKLEKLRGFEALVNIECLWLNSNRLKKLNNLDTNTRVKILYAQDNLICTLKGSLENFKFLEQLDLSNNQLHDLEKLLIPLARYKFLTHLNLAGNACCEEPDYRLHVIHTIPSLRVLDQHTVTPTERRKAVGLIGGDIGTLTVAFMQRIPDYNPAWNARCPERSDLEVELAQEAAAVRDKLSIDAWDRQQHEFAQGPDPSTPARARGLPPNAGTQRALERYAVMHADEEVAERAQQQQRRASRGKGGGRSSSVDLGGSLSRDFPGTASPTAVGGAAPGYQGRDSLDTFSLRASPTDFGASGTRMSGPSPLGGSIRFEQAKYETFVNTRTAGRGQWEMTKTRVVL